FEYKARDILNPAGGLPTLEQVDFFPDIARKLGFRILANLHKARRSIDVMKALLPDLQGILRGQPHVPEFLDERRHVVQFREEGSLRVGRTWQQEDAAHFEFKRREPAGFILIFDGNAEI